MLEYPPVTAPKDPKTPDTDFLSEFPNEAPAVKPPVDKGADWMNEFPDESTPAQTERRQHPRRFRSKLFQKISWS